MILELQEALQHLQGVHNAVDMATLIAVAGIDACTDETVANVVSGGEGGLHIGAVVGVDVNGKIGLLIPGGGDELGDQRIAVGAAGVLAADGDLPLCAG